MEPTALLLSRIQFAFTIAYHIIFPTLTMGLAVFLVFIEAMELRTKDPRWREAGIFWTKIFALSFGMGVVTGVVLSYEIGTNFGRFAEIAGPVVGPLMSYEVMSAFFLEAGFLGIVLFGRNRVSPKLHFFATCMVAIGTLMSAFWILAANSWMQTPAGFRVVDGVVTVTSWFDAIFNPSFPYRLAHMVTASFLASSFVIAAVGAWCVLNGKHAAFGPRTLKLGLAAATLLAPLQAFIGDQHGLNTFEHQPVKVAAMEAHWHSGSGMPLVLFGWPDEKTETNLFEVAVPKLGSVILTHQWDGHIRGLSEFPAADRPPVAIVFWSFRIMVGCGLVMLLLAWVGVFLWKRGTLESSRRYLQLLMLAGPLGFVAVLAGWVTTECGRQPWTIYGLLRTADSGSPVAAVDVATSLAFFVVAYALLFYAFARFFAHIVRTGPAAREPVGRAHVLGEEKS